MDKPAKKAIVIKVNGKEQPYTTATNVLPQWTSDESDERHEKQDDSIQFDSKRYKKRSPWRSFLLAIALAVVLGTSFGLFVLTIIPTTETSSTTTLQQEQKKEEPMMKPTATVFVVQGGVFQDTEAAKAYVQKIKGQHRPSVMVGKQPIYVFLGMALTKEEAKKIASLYEPLGVDTYVKTWNISVEEKEKEPFMTIVSAISLLLNGQPFSNEQWKQLQSYSFQDEHMKKAYEALFAFRQTNDQSQLWIAQQHLLNVLQ